MRMRDHDRIVNPELIAEDTPSKAVDSLEQSIHNAFISISNSPLHLITPSLRAKLSSEPSRDRHCHSRERSQSDPELRIDREVTLSILSPNPWGRKQLTRRQVQLPQDLLSPTYSNLESTDYDDDEDDTISPLSTPAGRPQPAPSKWSLSGNPSGGQDAGDRDPEIPDTDTETHDIDELELEDLAPLSLDSEQKEELSGGRLAITRLIVGPGPRIVYDESNTTMSSSSWSQIKGRELRSASNSKSADSQQSVQSITAMTVEPAEDPDDPEDSQSLAETTFTVTYQPSSKLDPLNMRVNAVIAPDSPILRMSHGQQPAVSTVSQLSALDESLEQQQAKGVERRYPQIRDDVKSEETEEKVTPRSLTDRMKEYQLSVDRMDEAKQSGQGERRESILQLERNSVVKITRSLFQHNNLEAIDV